MNFRSQILPVFLAAALTGCAHTNYRTYDRVIQPDESNECKAMVIRETIKPGEVIKDEKGNVKIDGEGKEEKTPDELVGTEVVKVVFSAKCSDDRVTRAIVKADGDVKKARIDAASKALVEALRSRGITPEGLIEVAQVIKANLNPRDPVKRQSQLTALKDGGTTENYINSLLVSCHTVSQANGTMELECN
jgi:hypothetical protein